MKPKRSKTNFFLVFAAVVLAGCLAVYASWILSCLKPRAPSAPSPLDRPVRTVSPDLARAREDYRVRFLEPAAHMRLAKALYESERFVDAFYVLRAARVFFGEDDFRRSHFHIILHDGSHFLGGQPFDASSENEARLQSVLKRSPYDPAAMNYLAHIAASQGNAKEAVRFVDLGLTRHPSDRALLLYRGELVARALSDFTGAVPWFAKLADRHPESAEGRRALIELGNISRLRFQGTDTDAPRLAIRALQSLHEKHPDDPSILAALGLSALSRGEVAEARALATAAFNRRADHAGALLIQGALALNDRRPADAAPAFTAACRGNPHDLYCAEKLSQLHAKHAADPEAAIPYYVRLFYHRPAWEDGEPMDLTIRRILDSRRAEALRAIQSPLLERFLRSEDASLRAQACELAAVFQDPRWIDDVGSLLDDDAEIVRHNADYALFRIAEADRDAVMVRRKEWLASRSPFTRVRALNLFADIDRLNTFPLVSKTLFDPSPTVRFLTKVMVMDHYYAGFPPARKTMEDYRSWEKDKTVLALYARLVSAEPAKTTAHPRAAAESGQSAAPAPSTKRPRTRRGTRHGVKAGRSAMPDAVGKGVRGRRGSR